MADEDMNIDDDDYNQLTDWVNSTQQCNTCNLVKTLDKFYFRKDNNKHQYRCKTCTTKYHKAKKQNNLVVVNAMVLPPIDYTKPKICKKCNKLKVANEFPKNGVRRKNICKSCYSLQKRKSNKARYYPLITESFKCRTCSKLITPQEVYIENKRNNKPSTQCKDCYMTAATIRKGKRRELESITKYCLTPQERKQLNKIYKKCKSLNKAAGFILYNVDHIKPLSRGGLHHPNNLQILTATKNRQKAASYAE